MICEKFDMGAENNLIRDFERENNTLIDAEKQVKNEEREKELEFERQNIFVIFIKIFEKKRHY